jgi:FMN phosphatase YigB (HAD superfamily)
MKNKKLVFDLDYTLYSPLIYPEKKYMTNTAKFYVDLKSDIKLGQLLKKSENYIFTNANEEHMDLCLKKMRIKTMFKNTAFNDLYKGSYKPNKDVYELVIKRFKFNENDTIYFFEDLKENLKTAKKYFNWNTVYLDHKNTMKKKPSYIDYKFTNIYDAIEFIQKL